MCSHLTTATRRENTRASGFKCCQEEEKRAGDGRRRTLGSSNKVSAFLLFVWARQPLECGMPSPPGGPCTCAYVCCPIPGPSELTCLSDQFNWKSQVSFFSCTSLATIWIAPACGVITTDQLDIKLCFFSSSSFFFKRGVFRFYFRSTRWSINRFFLSRRARAPSDRINAESESVRFDSYGRLHPFAQHCRGYKSKSLRGGGSTHIISIPSR